MSPAPGLLISVLLLQIQKKFIKLKAARIWVLVSGLDFFPRVRIRTKSGSKSIKKRNIISKNTHPDPEILHMDPNQDLDLEFSIQV